MGEARGSRPLDSLQPKRTKPQIEGVSSASVLGLKAQLLKKQQSHKAGGAGNDATRPTSSSILKNIAGDKRQGHPAPKPAGSKRRNTVGRGNPGVQSRATHDNAPKPGYDERLQLSAQRLEEKTKLYEALVNGQASDEDDRFEVDFNSRRTQAESPPASSPHTDDRRRQPPGRSPSPPGRRSCSSSLSPSPRAGTAARRASPSYAAAHGSSAPEYRAGLQPDGPLQSVAAAAPHGGHDDEAAQQEWRPGPKAYMPAEELEQRAEKLRADAAEAEERAREQRALEAAVAQDAAVVRQTYTAAKAAGAQVALARRKALIEEYVTRSLKRKHVGPSKKTDTSKANQS